MTLDWSGTCADEVIVDISDCTFHAPVLITTGYRQRSWLEASRMSDSQNGEPEKDSQHRSTLR